MEQAFRRGRIIEKDGKKEMYFEPSSTATNIAFNESLEKVVSVISCYDFNKIKNKDYYYIYKSLEHGGQINPKEIEETLESTFDFFEEDENTIFWDILNNIVVVKGKEELKQLCIELEWLGYKKYGMKFYDEERRVGFCLSHEKVPIIKKVKTL